MKSNLFQYTFSNKIYMFICWLRTKLFYSTCRLVRFPFDIRNRKNIDLGSNFTCGRCCRIEVCFNSTNSTKNRHIILGDLIRIGDFVHIAATNKVVIGNNVRIGSKSYISDICHGDYTIGNEQNIDIPVGERPLVGKPIIIHDNVWIGEMVSILPGVEIGEGAVIGALSCVTKSVPPFTIVVGNPARAIKKFNKDKCIWERV